MKDVDVPRLLAHFNHIRTAIKNKQLIEESCLRFITIRKWFPTIFKWPAAGCGAAPPGAALCRRTEVAIKAYLARLATKAVLPSSARPSAVPCADDDSSRRGDIDTCTRARAGPIWSPTQSQCGAQAGPPAAGGESIRAVARSLVASASYYCVPIMICVRVSH
jgi:hypothetical protein